MFRMEACPRFYVGVEGRVYERLAARRDFASGVLTHLAHSRPSQNICRVVAHVHLIRCLRAAVRIISLRSAKRSERLSSPQADANRIFMSNARRDSTNERERILTRATLTRSSINPPPSRRMISENSHNGVSRCHSNGREIVGNAASRCAQLRGGGLERSGAPAFCK
jgi:hypothetical protein